jgi:hypothetical protein
MHTKSIKNLLKLSCLPSRVRRLKASTRSYNDGSREQACLYFEGNQTETNIPTRSGRRSLLPPWKVGRSFLVSQEFSEKSLLPRQRSSERSLLPYQRIILWIAPSSSIVPSCSFLPRLIFPTICSFPILPRQPISELVRSTTHVRRGLGRRSVPYPLDPTPTHSS